MRVVVVDDDFGVLHSIKRVLSSKGFEVVTLQSSEGLEEYLPESNLLLMDIRLEGERGTDVVEKLRAKGFNIPVIFITAYADADAVVSASKLGAVDVLKKPFSSQELLQAVKNALEFVLKLEPSYSKELKVIGSSRAMFEVFKKVGLACQNDLNVLITGETGVGKEVVAKLIHENSSRKKGPFVILHCPAIPWDLFEAELFGYVKGAFTGALVDKKGKAKLAEGGTLFLDEIGDVPYKLQAKLLAFVERKSFFPLGSSKEEKADVRLIFATNRDLKKMVEEGKFREDLYHRISQLELHVPPLRERKEDIKPLVEYFVALANAELGTSVEGVEEQALRKLMDYSFPGNVRELKNLVYKAVLETRFGKIKDFAIQEGKNNSSFEKALELLLDAVPEEELPNLLERVELYLIKKLLERYSGNKSKVASLLGISRNTLESRLKNLK
ncbi:MAG: sigma-54-dependent transcriptional regulator [Thermocrinis sp.]|jgi:DNA-binding NtrC family response regulator|uniref:sigma-54-dependent transcriptional regulator n=1 Tax=Thermocrinis sp. TaxID=2024383 RepID=UPI003C0BC42B